jgi:hypothetical protein
MPTTTSSSGGNPIHHDAFDVGWFGQRCHHAATGTFLTSGAVGIALTGTTGRTARSGSRANGRLD